MKSADLRFQVKEHCCFMCFLWRSNELLIFLLVGVSSYSLRILECCSPPECSWIVSSFFPVFCCFSSSRYLYSRVFIFTFHVFLYSVPTVAFHAFLWPLRALQPACAALPLYSFSSLGVFGLRHIIPLTVALSALAFFFFLQCFLF